MGKPKGRNARERMRQSFRSSIRRWTNSPWRTIQRFDDSTNYAALAIVVQTVAKSLLILINRGDMAKSAMAFVNKPQIKGETKVPSAVRGSNA
jgi:hypothetical protein